MLVLKVLSSGSENERPNTEAKLKLYSSPGVKEYWIVDWQKQQIEYRREKAMLGLVASLFNSDELSCPLLPGFTGSIAQIFA